MARKHYKVDEVINALSKKNDIKFSEKVYGNIFILSTESSESKRDLGNRSQGKIDFLVNHNGFRIVSRNVKSFTRKSLNENYPTHFFPEKEKSSR